MDRHTIDLDIRCFCQSHLYELLIISLLGLETLNFSYGELKTNRTKVSTDQHQ